MKSYVWSYDVKKIFYVKFKSYFIKWPHCVRSNGAPQQLTDLFNWPKILLIIFFFFKEYSILFVYLFIDIKSTIKCDM